MSEDLPTASIDTEIASAAVWGGAVSVVAIAVAAARAKTTAVLLGPAGAGALAQLFQLATLSMTPAVAIIGPAFVARVARSQPHERAHGATFVTLVVAGLLLGGAAVLIGPWALPSEVASPSFLLTTIAGAAFGMLAVLPTQRLIAVLDYRQAQTATAVSVLLAGAGAVAGTFWGGILGHVRGFMLGSLAALFATWAIAKEPAPTLRRGQLRGEVPFLAEALRVGGATLASNLFLQAALVLIRVALDRHDGAAAVGHFSAAWSIGQNYFTVVLSGLSTYAFARFAQAQTAEVLSAHLDDAARFVLSQAVPVVLLATVLCEPILTVLYSREFRPAAATLTLQMAGDIPKAIAWMLTGSLAFRGHALKYAIAEISAWVLLAVSAWLLVPRFGVTGTGYAYLATSLVYLPVAAFMVARADKVRFGLRWILTAYALAFGILGCSFVISLVPMTRWAFAALGAVLLFRSPAARRVWQGARRLLRLA